MKLVRISYLSEARVTLSVHAPKVIDIIFLIPKPPLNEPSP